MVADAAPDGARTDAQPTLTPLEAARHLGVTPELLAAYSRSSFRKGDDAPRSLPSFTIGGRTRYSLEDLDGFDAYLRTPWSSSSAVRPKIPAAVSAHLKAESLNQCARCGSGSSVQTAHIEPWAATRSHHHHNLLRLCVACHSSHDADGIVPTTELSALKKQLLARTRAALDRRMGVAAERFRAPRKTSAYHGRLSETEVASRALQAGGALLISGVGGIGKTELLLQAIDRAETGRPVIWIDIAQHRDIGSVDAALQVALSVDGDQRQAADLPARLDELETCVVFDGIEYGLFADIDALDRRIAELTSSTLRAQFVATSQVALHRTPWDDRLVLGPLDDAASETMLTAGRAASSGERGDPSELLRICGGHALTLRVASALVVHFGTIGTATRVIAERGARAVAMPGVTVHDRTTSLSVCLSLAFEALTQVERKTLLLIAMAPAGLFAKQLEDDYFEIDGGHDAVAAIRRWHLVDSDGDENRERLTTLSPVRMFVLDRSGEENPETFARLKARLLNSIGIMVGVIEGRSSASEEIDYMIARYSEDMPNIRWLIAEAEAGFNDGEHAFLALAACSSLMRYFFVQRLSEEGAAMMRRGADLAISSGRPSKAAAFVAQMVALARRRGPVADAEAEALLERIEGAGTIPARVRGDLLVTRAMVALDRGNPVLAAQNAKSAFEAFKLASKTVNRREENDPDEPDGDPDEELVRIRSDDLHNDIASALRLYGDAMLAQGNYSRAAENYRHSLRHERGGSIAVNRGQIMHQIGNCESHMGNHEAAADCYLEAIARFYMVGMLEYLSNATGELGFTTLDCDPPQIQQLPEEVFPAALRDLEQAFAECTDPSRDAEPQRCIGLARKSFGTLTLCILTGRATLAGDWAFRMATERLGPMIAGLGAAPDTSDIRLCGMFLETPLHISFLVADLEESRDENEDPDEGLVRQLLATCCSVDSWIRDALRLADWLAIYLNRRLGVTNLTGERIAEFMRNGDDDIHDELVLVRAGR